jgi:rare lipoprotein A
MRRPRWAIGFLLLALPACSTPAPPPASAAAAPPPAPCMQTGTASWYRPKVAAKPTASGEAPGALVAAHPTLPFGTQLTVTELASGRSVVVRVADRGPFTKGRIIDLSAAAATQLGMRQDGVAQVRIEIYQSSSDAPGVKPACPFPKTTAA